MKGQPSLVVLLGPTMRASEALDEAWLKTLAPPGCCAPSARELGGFPTEAG